MENNTQTTEVMKIYQAVSDKILSGEYPAEYRLVETKLAEIFGVSRTPVRTAIERLISEGLVEHIPNRGALVRGMTIEEIGDFFQIRKVNEILLARLASSRVRPGDKEVFDGILAGMKKASEDHDLRTYYDLSHKIHLHIMDMAQNEFLKDFVIKVYRVTYRYHIGVMTLPGRIKESFEEHKVLADAILSQDPEIASKAMEKHLGTISAFYDSEKNKIFYDLLSNPLKYT